MARVGDVHYNSFGSFLELLKFLAEHNETINNVVGRHASNNLKLITHHIQKDIINASVVETLNVVIDDLDDYLFVILADESCDMSMKEQMIVILYYVDKNGCMAEKFFGIVHISDTSALSLKLSIKSLFARHGLSMARLQGQGYDGATNMREGDIHIASLFNKIANLLMLLEPHDMDPTSQRAVEKEVKSHAPLAAETGGRGEFAPPVPELVEAALKVEKVRINEKNRRDRQQKRGQGQTSSKKFRGPPA
ncbi:uncharacterized protein LOC131180632 [Hevea brasiliensis]|uniref:uncharacterized protein LOC131180632 n=1 Tax=Hevea brasiliensis TaxID=3981 RepID=UPI0025CCAD49|nr:uncharacterized protein LOC131180632 [Hevea brasiliensis]